MSSAYEILKCDVCGKTFTGPPPAEGEKTLCPSCGPKNSSEEQEGSSEYTIEITTKALRVRKGPGTDCDVVQILRDNTGTHVIIEEADGPGAKKWGKLKSGIGWISLDYTVKN